MESQTIYLEDSGVLTLNQNNFLFAFRFRSKSQYIESEVKITTDSYHDLNNSPQSLSFGQCTKSQFENLYFYSQSLQNELESIDLSEWYCPQSEFTFQLQSQVAV